MTDREIIDEILRIFMEDDDWDIYMREKGDNTPLLNKGVIDYFSQ